MLNEIHLFQGPTKAPTASSGGWCTIFTSPTTLYYKESFMADVQYSQYVQLQPNAIQFS